MFTIHPSMETLDLIYIPPESPWHKNRLIKGEKINIDKPLPIKYIYFHKAELGDWPATTNGRFLVSKRFSNVLKKMTDNYQELLAEVYQNDRLLSDEYLSFVLTNKYPALDWEHSDCRNQRGFAMNVRKIALSEKKLVKIPRTEKIF